MNTYIFFFKMDRLGVDTELQWTVTADRLSQALAHFFFDSQSFSFPIVYFSPRYEVINSKGKHSSRLLSVKTASTLPFNVVKNEN